METLAKVFIETTTGKKYISVLFGDILELRDSLDVMTVSAFVRNYYPLRRSLLGALDTVGISTERLSCDPLIDLRELSDTWLSRETAGASLPIRRIGCIEFSKLNTVLYSRNGNNSILYKIRTYFDMLLLAANAGVSMHTLGMPLLGTGSQCISEELVSIPILNECLRFLKLSETTEEIFIIERNYQKAAGIAEKLQRSYSISLSKNLTPSACVKDNESPLAFISYAAEDRNVADNLCAKLEARGIKVWYAPRNVEGDYASSIATAITNCSHFVVILSQESLHSEHVLNEVDLAFQELDRKIHFFPLKLDHEELGPAFKYYLSRQHWMDATVPPLERRLDEFVEKIVHGNKNN